MEEKKDSLALGCPNSVGVEKTRVNQERLDSKVKRVQNTNMTGQRYILHIALVIILGSNYIWAIDPFSTIVGIGSSLISLRCKIEECCDDSWIVNNFTKLHLSFYDLFGQHIAADVVTNALKAHLRTDIQPRKALTLSFHGKQGTGKTFVSELIVDSMFFMGAKSSFIHFFMARKHFPLEREADVYKMQLVEWIRGNVSLCERSVFVFDEVNKIPKGVLNAIKPFLDYHPIIDGVDYRKAIFIFLSNVGSTEISNKLLEFWQNGTQREQLKLHHFENLIKLGAFNQDGGFHENEAIESDLIDHYVPFLPLEKSHVTQCIIAEFKRRKMPIPSTSIIEEVMEDLTFGPEPYNLYSYTGCKRVSPKSAKVIQKIYDFD
ncbi:hypothetical protein L9F63_000339 [Diploptera punctata]|uniref:Torsin-1A C-terminal domain-containing protein n=1 Tax=Diploptera punctata TaxID=6984 RepID=A0AAD8AMK9_DIPPU|nr:hypothetical protein L9F63_000339 [Diploptera punctata]